MPDGRAELRPQDIFAARELGARRFRDAREREITAQAALQNTRLTEAAAGPSPIELPKKSYATRGEEGAPSRIAEMERQRARERKMAEAAKAFVGAPTVPEEAPAPSAPHVPKTRRRPSPPGAAAPPGAEEIAEEEMEEAAETGMRDEEQREFERMRTLIRRTYEAQKIQLLKQQALEMAKKQTFTTIKAALGGSSVSFISGIVLIILMNVQVINTYLFKTKVLPKATLKDVLITLFLDLLLLFIVLGLVYLILVILDTAMDFLGIGGESVTKTGGGGVRN